MFLSAFGFLCRFSEFLSVFSHTLILCFVIEFVCVFVFEVLFALQSFFTGFCRFVASSLSSASTSRFCFNFLSLDEINHGLDAWLKIDVGVEGVDFYQKKVDGYALPMFRFDSLLPATPEVCSLCTFNELLFSPTT